MALNEIKTMRAVRQFDGRPVSDEIVRDILNAGRRAQSSMNTQPWYFIVIRDRELLKQVAACGAYAGHMAGAAFAVVLIAPGDNDFDLGQAAAYLQLAAWEHGIGSCFAYLGETAKAMALLGIPAGMRLVMAISFGYPAAQLPSKLKAGGRRTFDEVVHWEKW